jgi:hypothetical protein
VLSSDFVPRPTFFPASVGANTRRALTLRACVCVCVCASRRGQLASGGRIVVLSVHQPSPAIFSLLDRTYLMAAGHCVYAGPPGAADAFFAARGLPAPPGVATAEHMLDCVSDPRALRTLLQAKQAAVREGMPGPITVLAGVDVGRR